MVQGPDAQPLSPPLYKYYKHIPLSPLYKSGFLLMLILQGLGESQAQVCVNMLWKLLNC